MIALLNQGNDLLPKQIVNRQRQDGLHRNIIVDAGRGVEWVRVIMAELVLRE